MTTMKYDVMLVPFPFDDLSSTKVRPTVCLTDPVGPHHHVVVAFITSQPHTTHLNSDFLIDANASDFTETGLRVSSTLQLHRLMTVTRSLFVRRLGKLSPRMQTEVEKRLRLLFEL